MDLLRIIIYDRSVVMKAEQGVTLPAARPNPTLNTILTFCAVGEPPKHSTQRPDRIRVNPKVGGVLTTNDDFLLEAYFKRKFSLDGGLSPLGRVGSVESSAANNMIPVYHIHGCIHYKRPKDDRPSDIVMTQEDYYHRVSR